MAHIEKDEIEMLLETLHVVEDSQLRRNLRAQTLPTLDGADEIDWDNRHKYLMRLAYATPRSRVLGHCELVDHPKKIALNYLKHGFIIDLFIVLPIPQAVGISPVEIELHKLIHEQQRLLSEVNRCHGAMCVYQSNISKNKVDLKQAQYKDIDKRYFD
ncbi:hypothetical protein Fmac_024287 [Flemingia macrophylla]|uniref:Uncharacterized protein n=1 Tax=Flemingia macrophylla TaxID=520843 RepID=A0ABD1LNY1_9FABA